MFFAEGFDQYLACVGLSRTGSFSVVHTIEYFLQRFVTTYLNAIPSICRLNMLDLSRLMYTDATMWFPNFSQVCFLDPGIYLFKARVQY